MSVPSIVLGLLIWLALPPLYVKILNAKGMRLLKHGCRITGIIFIAAGFFAGF